MDIWAVTDRRLSRLFNHLNQVIPGGIDNVAIVVSADHGVSAIPSEMADVYKIGAGRVSGSAIMKAVESALDAKYGEKAYEPAALKSPAQIEKLPGGKALIAKLAYKPDTGITLAPEDDNREPAVGLMARAAAEGKLPGNEPAAADDDI